jgi:CRISPR-associated protein Cmr2
MSTKDYVFIFSIGPVQSFIAEARRTADLYAGSFILSQLSAAAAKKIQSPHQLIFPHPDTLDKKTGTPNKLVAVLHIAEGVDTAKALAEIAQNAQKAAEKCWHDLSAVALMQLGLQDPKFHPLWERQKNNLLEFYWVALPIEKDYLETYRKANEALDARKRLRLFNQAAEDDLKDSLSGQRQALRTYKENAEAFWTRIAQRPSERRVKKHERLDTIAAIKRFGVPKPYPSVSTIASMDFAFALDQADKQSLMGRIGTVGAFYTVEDFGRGLRYDGDLLYTATYSKQRLKTSYDLEQANGIEPVVAELKRLYEKVGFAPSPYYAILVMDGDKMGRHLDHCASQEQHQEISKRLGNFAGSMEELVQKHHGRLVYAGGDDVFAFLPLSTALKAAAEINQRFQETFADWQSFGQNFPFTMSAGIAIVHHMAPLDWALAEARGAEKVAKNHYDRNAIVVRLLKRSGDSKQMGGRWETVPLVQQLHSYFKGEKLSSRMAHDLLAHAEVTTAVPLAHSPMIKLMLKRHNNKDNRKGLNHGELEQLTNELAHWVLHHEAVVPPKEDVKQGLTELGLWLTFARFMAQGGQDE